MNVEVILDPSRTWGWHIRLLKELERVAGATVSVRSTQKQRPLPTAVRLLLDLEQYAFKACDRSLVALVGDDQWLQDRMRQGSVGEPDIVLHLAGCDIDAHGNARVVRPLFDGHCSDDGLLSCLLAHELPELQVSEGGRVVMSARVAIERPECLTASLASVFSRLSSMLEQQIVSPSALDTKPGREAVGLFRQAVDSAIAAPSRSMSFAVRSLADRARGKLARLVKNAPHWRVAYRRMAKPGKLPAAFLDLSDFTVLPDDGKRFFGDPFAIDHEGVPYVFCEEFPFALGRGILSVFTVDEAGRPSQPMPILDTGGHLSYPFVFRKDGQIWMMPETSDRGRVSLWRAERFPDRWVEEILLVEGDLHDATLFRHDGRYWLLATERHWSSSTWDTLVAFTAVSLEGPWRPHPSNPLQIDPASSRPGGRIFSSGGRLWRPAQDCTTGYGHALAICEIEALDEQIYRQRVDRIVRFQDDRILGPHTLNWDAGLELIDLIARPSDVAAQ